MTATKEQIIETALQILARYEPLNRGSIKVKEEKIPIYVGNNQYYYKHDGWFFMIHSTQVYDSGYDKAPDGFLLYFLEDGTCIHLSVAGAGGPGINTNLIYQQETGYQWASREKFLAHYNFDFNNPKFEKVFH